MPTVMIDPGHGGMDPGAVYQGRLEKDDTLRLALEVGELLSNDGIDVLYTRTEDVYDSPYQKAVIANESNADYLVSLHRNASASPGNASGIQTLVYADRGVPAEMARAINQELVSLGFRDLGVIERPGLAVLRRSRMPAVLVEAGFIDNEADNQRFDEAFPEIARAIADGILETIREDASGSAKQPAQMQDAYTGAPSRASKAQDAFRSSGASRTADAPRSGDNPQAADASLTSDILRTGNNPQAADASQAHLRPPKLYRVQVGAFRNRNYAYELNEQLTEEGFPAFILMDGDWYKVQVGAFSRLENAIRMEYRLRAAGYDTYITT